MWKSHPRADDSGDPAVEDPRMPMLNRPEPGPAGGDGSAALVDWFLESYVFWRESCEAVGAAYENWVNCDAERRGRAFEDYRAALDWEERAAEVHAGRTANVRAERA